jgi:predicted esterase
VAAETASFRVVPLLVVAALGAAVGWGLAISGGTETSTASPPPVAPPPTPPAPSVDEKPRPSGPRIPGAPPATVAAKLGSSLFDLLLGDGDWDTREKALETLHRSVADWQEADELADPLSAHTWWTAALRATQPRGPFETGMGSAQADWFGETISLATWVPETVRPGVPPLPLVVCVLDEGRDPEKTFRTHYARLLDSHVIVAVLLKPLDQADADLVIEDPTNALLGLRHAVDHYPVDRDRVTLDGMDRGAGVVRAIAAHSAREFNGVVLRTPATIPEPRANLALFPTLVVHHVRAPTPVQRTSWQLGEDLETVEITEVAADDPQFLKEAERICEWMAALPPRRISRSDTEYAWHTISGAGFRKAGHRFVVTRLAGAGNGRLVRVQWRVDRETNTVHLETDHVAILELLLHDGILNLDERVGVVVNGKEILRKRVDRDIDTLVEWAQQSGTLVTAALKVRIPADARKR